MLCALWISPLTFATQVLLATNLDIVEERMQSVIESVGLVVIDQAETDRLVLYYARDTSGQLWSITARDADLDKVEVTISASQASTSQATVHQEQKLVQALDSLSANLVDTTDN